jgi:hypothetical protein
MIKYYLATDKVEVFHHGSYDDEIQELTTGQPELFLFDSEEELHKVLDEYGVDYSEPVEQQDPELLLPPLLENGDG